MAITRLFALRCTIAVAGLLSLRLLAVVVTGLLALRLLTIAVSGLLTLRWALAWDRGLFARLLVLGLVVGFKVDTVLDRFIETGQVELARDGLDRGRARR